MNAGNAPNQPVLVRGAEEDPKRISVQLARRGSAIGGRSGRACRGCGNLTVEIALVSVLIAGGYLVDAHALDVGDILVKLRKVAVADDELQHGLLDIGLDITVELLTSEDSSVLRAVLPMPRPTVMLLCQMPLASF